MKTPPGRRRVTIPSYRQGLHRVRPTKLPGNQQRAADLQSSGSAGWGLPGAYGQAVADSGVLGHGGCLPVVIGGIITIFVAYWRKFRAMGWLGGRW